MRRRMRTALALMLIAGGLWFLWPSAALAQGEGGGNYSGGSGDAITQLTQTVQQLAQQVQQVVQAVQQVTNFAGAIFQQAAGSLFGAGGTPPFLRGGGGAPSSLPTSSWLAQLQQWVTGALFQAGNSVWTEFGTEWGQAPDYTYSTTRIASQLQQLAVQLPGQVGQWVAALAGRIGAAPPPAVGTPQWSATQQAQQDPAFAARAHAVQQAQVSSTATQAEAQAAAQQSQQVAQQATADTTAQDAAAAAQQVAQQAASAVQAAPSTRAAVEVMAAALTQQQAQAIAASSAIASKLDALITQQTELGVELADAVAGLGTASGLLSQTLTQGLQDQAQSNVSYQNAAAGSASGLVGELNFIAQGGDEAGLDQFLSTSISGGP
jgi:hypothetical protein